MGGFIIQLSPSLVSTGAGKRRLQLLAFDQRRGGEEMPPPNGQPATPDTATLLSRHCQTNCLFGGVLSKKMSKQRCQLKICWGLIVAAEGG